jgi:hypothetical protein
MAYSNETLDSNTWKTLRAAVHGWNSDHEVVKLLAQVQNAGTCEDQKVTLEAIISTVNRYNNSANEQEKANNEKVLAAARAALAEVNKVAGTARDTAATVVAESSVVGLSAATSATVSPVSSATSSRSTSSINLAPPPASIVPAAAVAPVPVASTTATAASAATTPVTTASFGATASTAANTLSDILSRLSSNALKVQDLKQSGESHKVSRLSDGVHVADINTTTGQVTTTSHAKPDEQKQVFQAAMQHFSQGGTLEIKSVNNEGVGAMTEALKAFLSDTSNKRRLGSGALKFQFADTPQMQHMLNKVMQDTSSAQLLQKAMRESRVQVADHMKSLFADASSTGQNSPGSSSTPMLRAQQTPQAAASSSRSAATPP